MLNRQKKNHPVKQGEITFTRCLKHKAHPSSIVGIKVAQLTAEAFPHFPIDCKILSNTQNKPCI